MLLPGRLPAAESADVSELKRKLAAVTAEAEALWIYVESGADAPNVHALNRAMALYERRRRGKH